MIAIIRRRIKMQGWKITLRWLYVILLSKLFGYVPLTYSRITPHIYVGSQHRFLGKLRLRADGVNTTINLREEFDYSERSLVFENHYYIPVADETPVSIAQLEEGIQYIEARLAQGEKVYVHCASGVGRSVMLVVAYFIYQGMTFDEAFAKVKKVRPFVYLFPSQRDRMKAFEAHIRETKS